MELVTQLTAILPNRPGALADLLEALSDNKINVIALCVVDTAEHGLARFVVSEPEEAQRALEQCGIPYGTNQAISLALPNTPGALGDVARKLAKAKVNIDYAYASTSDADPARAILGVSNMKRARSALAKA